MLKKHLVLFESKDHGWIAYSTTGRDAKRILSVNKKYNIFYIFECDLLEQYPYTMKLKSPIDKRYETVDEGICFDVKHNKCVLNI